MLLSLPEIAAIRMPTFPVIELLVGVLCVFFFPFSFLFFLFFFPSVLPGQSLSMLTCAV